MMLVIYSENRFDSANRSGEYLRYVKYEPENKPESKLPLFIYVHGAGGRGDDLSVIKTVAPMGVISAGREINAVCVAPQCHADTWFELFDVLLEFIDNMRCGENIDQSRVYISGSSMGGYTTWQVIMSRPEWLAAAVPVCGGGMYWNAGRLKKLPIWAFHGALDMTVLPEESVKMVAAVNRSGGNAKLTIFPKCDHGSWVPAFESEELWQWIFEQRRED